MPGFKPPGNPWDDNYGSWDQLREVLGSRIKEGEADCAKYRVRTGKSEGDEEDAEKHEETRRLFVGAPSEHKVGDEGGSQRPSGHPAVPDDAERSQGAQPVRPVSEEGKAGDEGGGGTFPVVPFEVSERPAVPIEQGGRPVDPERVLRRLAMVAVVALVGVVALVVLGSAYFLFSGGGEPDSGEIPSVEPAGEAAAVAAPDSRREGEDVRTEVSRPDGDAQASNGATPEEDTLSARTAEESLGLDRSARRRIQAGLQAAGFDPGPVDGQFGAGTRAAIGRWQAARGVSATGYLNAVGAEQLMALGEAQPPSVDDDEPPVSVGRGSLTVRSEPASRIELNGSEVGRTDGAGLLALSDVQAGRHVVGATKEGHTAATSVVEVVAGASEVVELALAALPGTLTVTANFPGAILSIEDVGNYRLPVTVLEIPAGSHRVTVSSAGTHPVEGEVEIRAGETTVRNFALTLTVESMIESVQYFFDTGNYQQAVDSARFVLGNHPDAGDAVHLLLGRALFELGRFNESIVPLRRAIDLGQQIELDAKHRHSGFLATRPDFCFGRIFLSKDEVRYRSRSELDHNFSVTPDRITDVEVARLDGGAVLQVNTQIDGDDFDFVHRHMVTLEAPQEAPTLTVLHCERCDGSLRVLEVLMRYLSESSM